MRRHAWNCDLSTKPGTDILTNRHISYIYIYKSPTKQCFFKGVFNIRGMGLVISTRNHQIQLGFCAKLAILKTEACKNHFGRSSSLNASVPNDGAKRPSFRGWARRLSRWILADETRDTLIATANCLSMWSSGNKPCLLSIHSYTYT